MDKTITTTVLNYAAADAFLGGLEANVWVLALAVENLRQCAANSALDIPAQAVLHNTGEILGKIRAQREVMAQVMGQKLEPLTIPENAVKH